MAEMPSGNALRPARVPEQENALSRRYLHLVLRWIPIGMRYYNEWSGRPECGHFFGGVYWYGLETAAPMETLAIAASSAEYDPSIAGLSREEARHIARCALRYLCFTHDAGPADCLRPTESWGRKEPAGTKWGERGQGFFRESQCGVTIGHLARTAALLDDLLTEEDRALLRAVAADYLSRFGGMPPRSGVYADTQMEENGWTSEGLLSSLLLLPEYPRAQEIWENLKLWCFCTATMPQDMHDYSHFAEGRTVRDLCERRFTVLPDGSVENHYIVHPGYMSSCVTFLGQLNVTALLYGASVPPHAYWHRQDIYNILKTWADDDGALQPVQGMDWPYLSYTGACFLHAAAALFLQDRDASLLERRALAVVERSSSYHGGRMVPESVVACCHSIQDPAIFSERAVSSLAMANMAHRLAGEGPQPAEPEEFERQAAGVRIYPHGGFIMHRHGSGKTSFSWRNSVMVLPNTREGMRLVGPRIGSFLARVEVEGRARRERQVALTVREGRDAVAAMLVRELAEGAVLQEAFWASLPDGRSVTYERLTALQDIVVTQLALGELEVMNDPYLAPAGTSPLRTIYWAGGERAVPGYPSTSAEDELVLELSPSDWVNVDDRFGFRFVSSGRATYRNRHHFPVWHAVSDLLTLCSVGVPQSFAAGERIGALAALWCPHQSHEETASEAFAVSESPEGGFGAFVRGWACACNFGQGQFLLPAELRVSAAQPHSLHPGLVLHAAGELAFRISLAPKEVALLPL